MILKRSLSSGFFCFILSLILLFSSNQIHAQSKTKDFKISLQWQPIQNNFEGKSQSLSVLSLTNESTEDLPSNGWTLYFNYSGDFPKPDSRGLTISFVNGDLYKIEPNAASDGISAGARIDFQMVRSGNIENVTQSPQGFYLVFSETPDKAIPVKCTYPDPSPEFLNSLQASKTWMDPAYVYSKNQDIQDIEASKLPLIFPSPIEYKLINAQYTISGNTGISYEPLFAKEAAYLIEELGKLLNSKPSVKQSNTNGIILKRDPKITEEGYELSVSDKGIWIAASTPAGAFYGIQSLKSLIPPLSWKNKQNSIAIQAVEVKDEPRFGYRSFMLDVARNFQTKEEILKVLDLMSLYKLNVFHFHFSEDEGWRVEIPSLPELTQVGGVRAHTVDHKSNIQPAFASGGVPNRLPGSGHLSRKDFIEVLKYAAARHIQVIPEIESPGHARAAIKAMESRYEKLMKAGKPAEANRYRLIDPQDKSQYRSVQGWNDNVMDVALPSVYNFIERVTDDLILMYKEAGAPLKTIHYGGDEVPAKVWEKSPSYLKLKSTNPEIESTDDLWYYYFGKLNAMAKKRGLFVSGWEEAGMRKTILDGKPHYIANPDFADDHFQLHVWNNVIGWGAEDLAYKLANGGYKVVLSPVSNQYFDLAYNSSYYEPGYKWGGMVDVDKPFYFIPYDFLKNVKEDGQGRPIKDLDQSKMIRLTDYGKSNIVGLQGLLWSENNVSKERLEYMMLPKLLGLAERAWAEEPEWALGEYSILNDLYYKNSWSQFANRVGKRELPRLTYYNGGFSYRIPEPGLKIMDGKVHANIQLPGLEIRYTKDGSDLVAGSMIYTGPLTEKGKFRFAAFDASGRRGRVVEIESK
ncbi:MAG: beta-N-acetylhexosaminidase [Sphingobacteriales bacterium 17-39-43]|uniref:family 20 glycosylhydrolase n=1 Tax=Daejeonella sp. TaxID=2805397 RepID=UPI000BCA61CA|nr:family 20 glycosylhydrolase [Daejeonella sp.]OYZ29840.1 MAG: beta-N-acetylhexosaminidase [Sphingobacteriales bacterium 16-39-50]OZA22686.1 MAG: beta-N-acetylhexosaminidase [Sphingobacteriales bacterium 17-39-43]HQT24341.1 family 20 glycosylhydrolase [Daejeonella sp.]HQT59134.1 family 20 glycosylhydrolase [Daejeonella sp.]